MESSRPQSGEPLRRGGKPPDRIRRPVSRPCGAAGLAALLLATTTTPARPARSISSTLCCGPRAGPMPGVDAVAASAQIFPTRAHCSEPASPSMFRQEAGPIYCTWQDQPAPEVIRDGTRHEGVRPRRVGRDLIPPGGRGCLSPRDTTYSTDVGRGEVQAQVGDVLRFTGRMVGTPEPVPPRSRSSAPTAHPLIVSATKTGMKVKSSPAPAGSSTSPTPQQTQKPDRHARHITEHHGDNA